MDIPNFKELIQKLNIIRAYSSLLVPVVIAVAAVFVLALTPLVGIRLKKQIERQSISIGRQVSSLSAGVISAEQWRVEQAYQQVYENDANQIALLAKQSSSRELLSYKIFPEPKDTSLLIFKEFGRRFCEEIDELIVGLNARDCPTSAELERGLRRAGVSDSSAPSGSRTFYSGQSGVDATVRDILCRAKAKSACVYANPVDLSGYVFWKEYTYAGIDKAVEDCWYGQLAYWIIKDVVDTIAVMNSGSGSVFTSPVKRLMTVNFSATGGMPGVRGVLTAGSENRPRYVVSAEQGLTGSCTKRVCNDAIDVVHFNVSVVIDIRAVLPFMQQLCSSKKHEFRGFSGEGERQQFEHNQITVLRSEISSISREDETHNLYRYGDDAVVKLDLVCEYVFNKGSYDEVKPQSVKESLKKTGS